MGLSGTICVEKRASIKKWKQDQIKRNEECEREREREFVRECIPLPLLVWRKSRVRVRARANISNFFTYSSQIIMWGFKTAARRGFYMKNMILSQIQIIYINIYIYISNITDTRNV